jgi:5-formyltetrahydrofolate cyclo-ligase
VSDPSSKVAWRKQLRSLRRSFVETTPRTTLKRLWRQLAEVAVPQLPMDRLIASYWAVGSEIDPVELEAALRGRGATIALPRTAVVDGPLHFHVVPDHSALEPGRLAIPEPRADSPVADPRVLLVPLVGVDRRGVRLGQAGGYYDRTLAALRANGPVFAVGLAYDCQLVDALPCDPWDQRLDALATPTQWLEFKIPSGGRPDRA